MKFLKLGQRVVTLKSCGPIPESSFGFIIGMYPSQISHSSKHTINSMLVEILLEKVNIGASSVRVKNQISLVSGCLVPARCLLPVPPYIRGFKSSMQISRLNSFIHEIKTANVDLDFNALIARKEITISNLGNFFLNHE